MNPYSLSLLFFSFCSLLVGLFVLLKRSDEIGRVFFFFSVFAATWALAISWDYNNDSDPATALMAVRIAHFGAIFIPASWFHFISMYLGIDRKRAGLIKFLYFCSAVIATFSFSKYFIPFMRPMLGFKYFPYPGPFHYLFTAEYFVVVFLSFFELFKRVKQTVGEEKRRLKVLIFGFFWGYCGGSLAFLPIYGIPCPQYGLLFMPLYPFIMAYAMVKHGLLEQQEILAIHREKLALLGLLSSTINHEIKNPLFVLQEFARKMKQIGSVSENGEAMSMLDKMSNQIERASKLVARLSEFGCPNLHPGTLEEVDIPQSIQNALFFASQELQYRSVELTLNLDPNLPKLRGDKSQFEEIFLNLIVNAYHAMPKGGRLTIAANTVPNATVGNRHACSLHSQSKCVEITIADTGTGIRKHDLKDIFKPFYTTKYESGRPQDGRASPTAVPAVAGRPDGHSTASTEDGCSAEHSFSSANNFEEKGILPKTECSDEQSVPAVLGTGLGLYIVKTLVEQNHGTIQVESEMGKGTVFSMMFPALK